jgi:type I restriction enzyme R subunit
MDFNHVGKLRGRGFAKHMRDALPKASFIGFTSTPIESGDKNTQAVFGE